MQITGKAACLIFLLGAGLMTSGNFVTEKEPDFQRQSCLALLKKLFAFDLAKVFRKDDRYLTSIDADFDADNQQYFVEQHNEQAKFPDSGYLFIFSYAIPDNVTLSAFAPEEQQCQWVKCRLRRVNGRIFGRIVFQPDGECCELMVPEAPGVGSRHQITQLATE